MKDQAESLRLKIMKAQGKQATTVAVVSGKGGVGKSNFSMNFAISLAKNGKKVLLFDLDIGMGNIHILSGQVVDRSIADFFAGEYELEEIILQGPNEISYVFGGSGLAQIVEWSQTTFERWLDALESLQYEYDYFLFDMGAGATSESLELLMSVDEMIVLTTPEPTAITDAYSMMKYIQLMVKDKSFYLVCNRAETKREGVGTLERLSITMRKFLQKEVNILGVLPEDPVVKKAVIAQTPFLIHYPKSSISRSLELVVQKYLSNDERTIDSTLKRNFIHRLRHFFFER
ncbi:flagellar biosynthesis protein FlhG [Oikeobacillus pervagus]|uniref:Flagellar biosynthesis protein FlhG n=1 Tax=Oikeobacillus pervagus TaxID=1325931 RepID=A0AAJ1SWS1_9BACI|nr:MinD/ParA family protein [Oikeobacillus pervagus]MDQ0214283.1 flagellar biosynthesis protein FlhG [Oikeobacillus pervagus]